MVWIITYFLFNLKLKYLTYILISIVEQLHNCFLLQFITNYLFNTIFILLLIITNCEDTFF